MITLEQDLTKLKNLRNSIESFKRFLDCVYSSKQNRKHLRRSQKKLKRLLIVIGKKSNLIETI